MIRATVLWTGGKDSALAFYKARLAGYKIVNLLTFVPEKADFLAHPLPFMKYQAEALGISHYEAVVDAPLEEAYENAIRSFKKQHGVEALITGDIAEIDGQPNWVRQRGINSNIDVIAPLWNADRNAIFIEMLFCGFKAIISCIKRGSLAEKWLGKELDKRALNDLRKLNSETGLDICGENGEYHTLVLDGPIFKKQLVIGNYSKQENDSLMYIRPDNITLTEKG